MSSNDTHQDRATSKNNAVTLVAMSVLIVVNVIAIALTTGCTVMVGKTYETRDGANYGIYEGHIEAEYALRSQFSQLLVFPKELSDDLIVNDFYYSCSNRGMNNSYQLLLDYQLSPEDFQAEIERLRRISVSFEGQVKHVIYDTKSFKYPAYVTVYEKDGDCEFALIDEENHRIIAVLSKGDGGSLEKGLFPQGVPQYEDAIDWLGFSIYQFEVGHGVADMAR